MAIQSNLGIKPIFEAGSTGALTPRAVRFQTSPRLFRGTIPSNRLFGLVLARADAKRLQEAQILHGKRSFELLRLSTIPKRGNLVHLQLVQANRRLEHEQDIESLFADVLHDAGYMLRLRDRLMDR